ncbi:MAG: aminopeptidase [Desulfonatronovibrionaceae bacterium]
MFSEEQLEKYSQVMIWGMKKARGKPFQAGDFILLRTGMAGLPLAQAIYKHLLRSGMVPVVRMLPPEGMEKDFFALAGMEQVQATIPGDQELYSSLAGAVSVLAPEELTHLQQADAQKIAAFSSSRKYLRDILNQREAKGEFGWTLCLYPTSALAGHAGMSPEEYSREIARAVYLDRHDPAFVWEGIFDMSTRIKRWLSGMDIKSLHVRSENIDLEITPGEKRDWLGLSGHNIPSFEIFISPDWRGTNGTYYADQPSFKNGNIVKGVRLKFKDGEVTDIRADQGRDFVRKQVGMDAGAGRIGEFSLTDRRMSRIGRFMAHTLFDENFGGEFGNCHLALGAAYPESYSGDVSALDAGKKAELGLNDSALHWDLVNTEDKTVHARLADGREVLVYAHGEFQLGDLGG